MKRCFLALRLTDTALAQLGNVQREIVALPDPGATIRLLPSVSLHITIKFLGATSDAQMPMLETAMEDLTSRLEPYDATVSGLGAFPDVHRPRSVFACLGAGAERIVALIGMVEQACHKLGFPADERAAVPHVTLARLSDVVPRGHLSQWLQSYRPRSFGAIDGKAMMLFESTVTPTGSLYTPVANFPFGGRDA